MGDGAFPIRDVCKFLGVQPHVVRYWEQEVPLLTPRKSRTGHRVYTWADLEILFRIRHLLYDKGYTLAGVRNRIWEEATGECQNARARVMAVRTELLRTVEQCRELRRRLAEAATPIRTRGTR